MDIHNIARPGATISQIWPQYTNVEGGALKTLNKADEYGYFSSYPLFDIASRKERLDVRSFIENNGKDIRLTYCITNILIKEELNLSDLNEINRLKSVNRVISLMQDACEIGASAMQLVPGSKPKNEKRERAMSALRDSVKRICRAALDFPGLNMMIEPMDTDIHKMGTLGTTDEGIELCRSVEKQNGKLWLTLDTSHMILNGEDPIDSLRKAKDYTYELHICNPVTDRSSPFFGDQHIMFDGIGEMNKDRIVGLFIEAYKMGFLNETQKPNVMFEISKPEKVSSEQVMQHCYELFVDCWAQAEKKLGI